MCPGRTTFTFSTRPPHSRCTRSRRALRYVVHMCFNIRFFSLGLPFPTLRLPSYPPFTHLNSLPPLLSPSPPQYIWFVQRAPCLLTPQVKSRIPTVPEAMRDKQFSRFRFALLGARHRHLACVSSDSNALALIAIKDYNSRNERASVRALL